MDLNRLTRDADDLIRKVVSRYNQLYVPAGNISQLELDLMLDDLRKLYDTFKTIGQLNLTRQHTASKPEVSVNTIIREEPLQKTAANPVFGENPFQTPALTTAVQQPEPEPEIVLETEPEPEFIPEPEVKPAPAVFQKPEKITSAKQNLESSFESPIKPEPEVPDVEKPVHYTDENNIPAANPESANTTLADRFNTGNKSLSESMSSVPAQGVMGSRLLFQPIADLTSGIGLNDKFSFISEIFSNNATQYDEAISRINKAVNLDEANWILQKYHTAEWDHKQEILARLKDFIKRRFI
jgi:hypothetical protein